MKYLVGICMVFLMSGCVPDIQGLIKQQSENCSSHIAGSLSGGIVGTQVGILSFSMDCQATGIPPVILATPTTPAVKSPL